jgi:hypothetical protein
VSNVDTIFHNNNITERIHKQQSRNKEQTHALDVNKDAVCYSRATVTGRSTAEHGGVFLSILIASSMLLLLMWLLVLACVYTDMT